MPVLIQDEEWDHALADRRWVPLHSTESMGVVLPTPDPSPAPSAQIVNREGTIVYDQVAAAGPAPYAYQITNPYTARTGVYAIRWSYYRSAALIQEVTAFEVGRRAPTYQALPPPMRDLIESTYVRFADLIDSPLASIHR